MRRSLASVLALLLAAAAAFGLFAGCGKDPQGGQSGGQTGSQTGSQTGPQTGTEGQGPQTGGQDEETPFYLEDDGMLNVLCIGNSFSNDAMSEAAPIAAALGVPQAHFAVLYIGGCTLAMHASNARRDAAAYELYVYENGVRSILPGWSIAAALAERSWDVVSMQQSSGQSGIESSYADLDYLVGYVRERAPQAKLVWHMTWAYQGGYGDPEFSNYGNDQQAMYESIVRAVQSAVAPRTDFWKIVPTGTAIQNARTSWVGDAFTIDGRHLSLLGRYTAGLTFLHSLTGKPVRGIAYRPSGVAADEAVMAAEAAEDAVSSPFAVTPSDYPV